VNPDFIQAASPLHLTAYFSIFQKILWLLHKHNAIYDGQLERFIGKIHEGFFGMADDDSVPFGTLEFLNHLSWQYAKYWNDNFTGLYALASLLAIKRWTNNFDELFIRALSCVSAIRKPSDLIEDQVALMEIANSYDIPQDVLCMRLTKNIERLLPDVLKKLEEWNTTATIMLKDAEEGEGKVQRNALLNIGIAGERIGEQLRNNELQIYYCTEVIFWASQLNLSDLHNQYQERLIDLFKQKGDLRALARALINQGRIHNTEHDYRRAMQSFLQAKSLAKELKDESLLNTTRVYLDMTRFLA
jgi:hypothetical protein